MHASDQSRRSTREQQSHQSIDALYHGSPIPPADRVTNLHCFLRRQQLARLFMLQEIYGHILNVPGSILQCGVRWGGDLVTFQSLRAMLEPYNHGRRILGFDTFEGLKGTGHADAGSSNVADGQFTVPEQYEQFLGQLLDAHRDNAPLAHVQKHTLIKGDVTETLPAFLSEHPGEQIALLYLDMDIYNPTHAALKACLHHLTPGSIVAFDEYSDAQFPGEATSYRELLRPIPHTLHQSRFSSVTAYAILQ